MYVDRYGVEQAFKPAVRAIKKPALAAEVPFKGYICDLTASRATSTVHETSPDHHRPRARPPAESLGNPASSWLRGHSAPRKKYAPQATTACQSCRHPV